MENKKWLGIFKGCTSIAVTHSDRFVGSDDRDTIILMAHANTIKRG